MNNNQEIITLLNLELGKFMISVFDQDYKKIYEDIFVKEKSFIIQNEEKTLREFLDKNIYKIEKITNIFIKKINLVIDSSFLTSINVSIKRKSFGKKITVHVMKQMLLELREQIKKNNLDKSIIHMLILNYLADGQLKKNLDNDLNCDDLILETQFICLSNNLIKDLNNKFKFYQVEVNRIISADYARKFILNENLSVNEKAIKILRGENLNEVQIVPKKTNKKGFFEKFFNLFN